MVDSDKQLTGRELDAVIAQRVIDILCDGERTPDDSIWCHRHGKGATVGTKHYSSDIAAAMEVVERFRERGLGVAIADNMGKAPWEVRFVNDPTVGGTFVGEGDTLPLAICRAALESVKGEPS